MSLRSRPVDPHVLRELEELDRALAGDAAAEPELLALAADVRAEAPAPDPAFTARLDGLLAAGFPEHATPRPRTRRRRRVLVALPALASVLVGAVVLTTTLGGGDEVTTLSQDRGAASGGAASDGAASSAAPSGAEELRRDAAPEAAADPLLSPQAASPAARSVAPSPVPPVAPAPSARERLAGARQVERSADLALATGPDEVQDVATGVVRATQAAGGYVATSDVEARPDGGVATFTLRVPSARLDAALARLSRLADVTSLRQGSQDITASVDSAADRLSDARAERRGIQRALARATDAAQLRELRVRLRSVRSQVARLQGELDGVRRRAALATVAVTVTGSAQEDGAGAGGGDGWTPGDALADAGRVLEVAAGVALVALAVLVPLGALAVLAALAARALRRRRREATLG